MKPSAAFPTVLLTLAIGLLPCLDSLGVTLQAELVKDISIGDRSSSLTGFVKAGQLTYFVAEDATSGRELWKTDGTQAGTVRVKDIRPGTEGSFPSSLVAAGERLYFVADDGVSGREVWISDGTEAGTCLGRDIWPGSEPSSESEPAHLVALGRILFFTANGNAGSGLWRTDGTADGTAFLSELSSEFVPSPSRGVLFFGGPDGELWKSNSTIGGTTRIKDLGPGEGDTASSPSQLIEVSGTLYFSATTAPDEQNRLWKSDGTEAGTVLVAAAARLMGGWLGLGGFDPQVFRRGVASVGGTLFYPGDSPAGLGPWKTDGTKAGTGFLDVIEERATLSVIRLGATYFHTSMLAVGQTLYFTAARGSSHDWDLLSLELWRSDGTELGTALVSVIGGDETTALTPVHLLPNQVEMAELGGRLFFGYLDKATGTYRLWHSDGTQEGTVPIVVQPKPPSGFLWDSVVADGTILFATTDDAHGTELWKVRLGPWFEKLRVADGRLSGEIFDAKGGQFQLQGSSDLQQ